MSKIYLFLITVLLVVSSSTAYSQMKDDHLLGDFGLSAGTQASPSLIVAVPFYGYNASSYKNDSGDKFSVGHMNSYVLSFGGSIVTNFKILNANYGASLLFCLVSDKIDGNLVSTSSSLNFSDTYVQPIQLGWHWKKVDLTAGYGLYIPTGKYEYQSDDNTGLGMWTHELSVGATWYLDKKKSFNVSTIGFYGMHSKKRGTDLKTGDILTLEGRLSKMFIVSAKTDPWIINVGPVYYAQFKVTDDDIAVNDQTYSGKKDRIFGLGMEASVIWPKISTSLSARWLGEMGARNRYEGNAFMITLGHSLLSFEKKK